MMYQALFLALFFLHATECHKMEIGTCPKPQGKTGFDFKSFTGAWYVIHKVKTSVTCLMDAFYKESDGQLMFNEQSLAKKLSTVMKLEADMTVLDTDYENWAVIFKCQQWPIVHRKSGSIMVRSLNFDNSAVIEKAFKMLEATSISRGDMRTISNEDCIKPKEANFVFNIDGIKVGVDGTIGGRITDTVSALGETLSTKVNETLRSGSAKEDYEKFDPQENIIDDTNQP